MRFKNIPHLSLGSYISCFYLPFTEYNIFGDRVAGSYYTESVAALNISYNILAGYDFKVLALGATIKSAWRGMPDYTDNNTNAIIAGSGLSQSAIAFMGDVGLMLQFNFLKFYYSRDPNVRIGFSAQNLGVSLTGIGKKLQLDDPLPTVFAAGLSLKFLKPITLTMDYQQPFNLQKPDTYLLPYLASGINFQFTDFLSLLGGFALKGGNPRFCAGFEFEVKKIRFNFNYTLDFTSSFSPLNRVSLSMKLLLGDQGRSIIDQQVDDYYQQGLLYYAEANYEAAIEIWKEALKLNKRFDPAKLGIQSAQYQIDMFEKIRESLLLD
jgi:tetratricopeptide (TPR) repeat protein